MFVSYIMYLLIVRKFSVAVLHGNPSSFCSQTLAVGFVFSAFRHFCDLSLVSLEVWLLQLDMVLHAICKDNITKGIVTQQFVRNNTFVRNALITSNLEKESR